MGFSLAAGLKPSLTVQLTGQKTPRLLLRRLLLGCVAVAATAWINGAAADRGAAERRDQVAVVTEAPGGIGRVHEQGVAFERPGAAHIALNSSGAGSLLINASIGGRQEEFLLDTGAAMVTISRRLHRHLESNGVSTPVREVAARLADGRLRTMSVHRIESLDIGSGCVLSDVEVLVAPGEGRNLLGLNALSRFAPFTLSLQPMSLELSNCGSEERLAARQSSPAAGLPSL